MSLQIKLSTVDDIDLHEYSMLQQKSFAAVFADNKMGNSHLDPAFFRWKYNTPAGQARIAFVEENTRLLASVAMYPVYMSINGATVKNWHFVEAAVLPEARGRGLFQHCMNVLIDSLTDGEIIYVFPNGSSIHGTMKVGFRQIEQCCFYARFFSNVFKAKNSIISTDNLFTSGQDEYADELCTKHDVIVIRNAAFMNWRYKQHPHFLYYTFSPVENGRVIGNVVARPVIIKGQKMLLIMEMHGRNEEVQTEMMSFLKAVAKKENCFVAGMFSAKNCKPSISKTGMIPVPSFIIPKRHILMAYEKRSTSLFVKDRWFNQTGDWDAF